MQVKVSSGGISLAPDLNFVILCKGIHWGFCSFLKAGGITKSKSEGSWYFMMCQLWSKSNRPNGAHRLFSFSPRKLMKNNIEAAHGTLLLSVFTLSRIHSSGVYSSVANTRHTERVGSHLTWQKRSVKWNFLLFTVHAISHWKGMQKNIQWEAGLRVETPCCWRERAKRWMAKQLQFYELRVNIWNKHSLQPRWEEKHPRRVFLQLHFVKNVNILIEIQACNSVAFYALDFSHIM